MMVCICMVCPAAEKVVVKALRVGHVVVLLPAKST